MTRGQVDRIVAVAGCALVVLSLPMRWFITRLGTSPRSFRGVELWLTSGLVVVLALLSLVALMLATRTKTVRTSLVVTTESTAPTAPTASSGQQDGRNLLDPAPASPWRVVATLSSLTVVMGLTTFVVIAELVAFVIVPDAIPDSLEQFAVGVGASTGLWCALGGAAVMLIANLGHGGRLVAFIQSLGAGILRREGRAIAPLLIVAGALLIARGRTAPWLLVESKLSDWNVNGWALPWIGIIILMGLYATFAVGLAAALRPTRGLGVLAVTLGWMLTLSPALVIIAGRAMSKMSVPSWLRDRYLNLAQRAESATTNIDWIELSAADRSDDLDVAISVGWGSWLVFIGALVVAVGGVTLLAARNVNDRRNGRSSSQPTMAPASTLASAVQSFETRQTESWPLDTQPHPNRPPPDPPTPLSPSRPWDDDDSSTPTQPPTQPSTKWT